MCALCTINLQQGGRFMKKNIVFVAAMSFVLLFFIPFAHGALADRPRDGKQIVEKSRFMIDEGQKLKNAGNPDRAWLMEQGQMIYKQGTDATNSSKMMKTLEGGRDMQRIGQKLLQTGNLLLKMGKQKGDVSPEEKAKIIKQGDTMQSFGNLMLKKGQNMGGE
jgi:thymidine phosphorylase